MDRRTDRPPLIDSAGRPSAVTPRGDVGSQPDERLAAYSPSLPPKSRRRFLRQAAIGVAAAAVPRHARAAGRATVIVIGGGFAGATAARYVKRAKPSTEVALIEPNATYTACPFSNLVITSDRAIASQQFDYGGLAAEGIAVHHDAAAGVDPALRLVRLASGAQLAYDRLILAPGIDMRWNDLEGYDSAAAERLPHAWKAGPQTLLLRDQLQAMPDGGLVVIAAPENPFRCPPGPYERASLIAGYLQRAKPRSKVLILDAKDSFSKKTLFLAAWKQLYGDMIEWRGMSDGGRVVRVDAAKQEIVTDFDTFQPAVANVIPPQRAGAIAIAAGVADASGWCPIDPVSFESKLVPDIHVIGDAAIANAMPKSAFAANAQAKVCAGQVARLLNGVEPVKTTLANTCYSLVSGDYGISVAGVYRPGADALLEVEGAGGVSPTDAPAATRALEARYANDWFGTITREVFG